MTEGALRVAGLYRYPVKGLTPERLPRVRLEAGGHMPADRLFAIENGPSGFDPAAPVHKPKIHFLMLMKQAALARVTARYDDATDALALHHEGREVARGDLATPEGRAAIEAFFATAFAEELRGPPRLLRAPDGFRFTDSRSGFVSLINLASVAELETRLGAPVDPLRFRGNVHVEGLPARAELGWPEGTTLRAPGGLTLRVLKRIDRCAATEVDPATGLRDLPIPRTLMAAFGHIDCGVYCAVETGGALAEGMRLDLAAPSRGDDGPGSGAGLGVR